MNPDTLHLTLAFLGEVDKSRVATLQTLLQQDQWQGGRLCLDSFGRFRGPRIVWSGPSVIEPWLADLYQSLWHKLALQGFAQPVQPFRPHVSLLRRAGPQDPVKLPPPEPVLWIPRDLRLVASRPQSDGSFYQVLAQVPVLLHV